MTSIGHTIVGTLICMENTGDKKSRDIVQKAFLKVFLMKIKCKSKQVHEEFWKSLIEKLPTLVMRFLRGFSYKYFLQTIIINS